MSELLIHARRMGGGMRRRQGAGAGKYRRRQVSQSQDGRGLRAEEPWPPTKSAPTRRAVRHSSLGHGRSSVEQTDWHDQAERAFLAQLVKHLDAALAAGKVKSLIMVAPPRALGVLRPAYTHALRAAVRAELDKDFVKLPVYQIEKHLTGA